MWVLRASCLVRISTDSSWFSPLRMESLNHPCKRRTPGCIRFSRLPDTSVHWPFHQDVGTARTVESRRSTGNTTIGIGSYGCYSIVWFCAEKLALGVAHTSQNTRMAVLYKRPVMLAGVYDRDFPTSHDHGHADAHDEAGWISTVRTSYHHLFRGMFLCQSDARE